MNVLSRPTLTFFIARPATFAEIIPFLSAKGLNVESRFLTSSRPPQRIESAPAVQSTSDVVIIEHSEESRISALFLASEIKRADSNVSVVIATRDGSEELAIATLRAGLQDYIKLPSSPTAFWDRVQQQLRHRSETVKLTMKSPDSCSSMERPGGMITASDSMTEIRSYLSKAANSDCTVLVTGETGTGKELVADFIHENSPRRNKPFICINCAAIPDSLLESELFGHTKGAFTGAQELAQGLLAAAHGGTVFLDEIGDLSPVGQAKILRVLETRQICRLGGTKQMPLDVRFVAATNQDLYAMTAQKTFRQDLLFRLDVAHVHLPPLRERKEDILLLIQEFGRQFSRQKSTQGIEFTKEFLDLLLEYDWPGNIRELKNVIECLFLLGSSGPFDIDHLPARVRQFLGSSTSYSKGERELLISTLFSTKWNKTKAAEMLNWSRMTLYRKIAKYHIPDNCLQG